MLSRQVQQFWREWVQLAPRGEGETKGYHWDKQAALEARTARQARQAANKAAKKATKAARKVKCPSGLEAPGEPPNLRGILPSSRLLWPAPPVFAGKQG